jgi:hypothetical protein
MLSPFYFAVHGRRHDELSLCFLSFLRKRVFGARGRSTLVFCSTHLEQVQKPERWALCAHSVLSVLLELLEL